MVISSALSSPFQCPDRVEHWAAAATCACLEWFPGKWKFKKPPWALLGAPGWMCGCPRLALLELFHTGLFADEHFCCSWHNIWPVYGWDIRILLRIVETSPSSVENCRSLPAEYGQELPARWDFKLFSGWNAPSNAFSHFQTPRYQFSD